MIMMSFGEALSAAVEADGVASVEYASTVKDGLPPDVRLTVRNEDGSTVELTGTYLEVAFDLESRYAP